MKTSNRVGDRFSGTHDKWIARQSGSDFLALLFYNKKRDV